MGQSHECALHNTFCHSEVVALTLRQKLQVNENYQFSKCILKKGWVHLSHQGAELPGQEKEEPSGNSRFGVKTAWPVVCCWEFLSQQTVWSLEGVSGPAAEREWGERESSGTADRRGQLPSEWVPFGRSAFCRSPTAEASGAWYKQEHFPVPEN